MRNLFALLIFFCSLQSFAQSLLPTDSTTGKVSYSGVVNIEGANQEDLYLRAREWFANTFKSANSVLQMDDKEAGKLIGKGYQEVILNSIGTPIKQQLWFTAKVFTKDGRYRYEITDLYMQYPANKYNNFTSSEHAIEEYVGEKAYNKKGELKENYKRWIESIDSSVKETVASIQRGMQKTSTASKEDW